MKVPPSTLVQRPVSSFYPPFRPWNIHAVRIEIVAVNIPSKIDIQSVKREKDIPVPGVALAEFEMENATVTERRVFVEWSGQFLFG
jgi:hypothetical protein